MFEGGSYKEAIKSIYSCSACGLARFRTNIVVYRGNPRSDIMVVGEGPGEKEDLEGKPMVGPTGSYLVSLLEKNGLDITKIYITNVILCREPGNVDPDPEHARACYPNLMKQIKEVKPRYILAVGRHAARALIPNIERFSITQIAGNSYTPPHLGGAVVIPIAHPSYIMRARSLTASYEKMLGQICTMIKEGRGF